MILTQKTIRKYIIWALFTAPALYILYRFKADIISYGEVIHKTGELSVYFLFVSLAVTPLRNVFSNAKWVRWLVYHRRAIGVASFGYAALHTAVYVERKWGYDLILNEAMKPSLMTGWIALAIFLALALTSNNPSVAALKRRWQLLHRLVYAATALTIAHWALASFESRPAYIFMAALLAIQSLRFIKRKA